MPAFVFPGQGAQRPGMGRPWIDHPSWEVVADASEAAGRDIGRLLLDARPDELTETSNAQLATFTFSLLVIDAVERLGIEPTGVAGHSVGEFSALAATGAIGFEDGVRLVTERGEAMQAAGEGQPGTMSVIGGCDAETADVACRLADGDVWVASFNSAEETVIGGEAGAVARAESYAMELGARHTWPVGAGVAVHTPFMAPVRSRLRKILATVAFHDADVPVVTNVDGRPHTSAQDWARLLTAQLVSPVRWRQSVMRLDALLEPGADAGRLFVELGAGEALSGMIGAILPNVTTVAVSVPADLNRLVDAISGDTALHDYALGHQGEHLYISERVVISPGPGIFRPAGELDLGAGTTISVGSLLGTVSGVDVRSPFAGRLEGALAQPGERVQTGQPIAWLHAS